jgi:hypothetical protein
MRYGAPVQHIVELVGETIAQKVGAIRVAKKEEKKVGYETFRKITFLNGAENFGALFYAF